MNRRNVLVLGAAAFPPRLGSIAAVAKQNGWNLHIDRLSRCDDGISYDGAIVLLAWNKSEIRFARRLARRGVPLVDLAYVNAGFSCPRVIGDNVEIGKMAAEHFSARGFKYAIWFASGWSAAHQLRFKGFKGAFSGKTAKWIKDNARGANHPRRKTSIYDWLASLQGKFISPASATVPQCEAVTSVSEPHFLPPTHKRAQTGTVPLNIPISTTGTVPLVMRIGKSSGLGACCRAGRNPL